ncbi:ferrochelatase [Caldichromatium japonicum]|uniref:Ferrochelatase n=1 Tax=Caldichromatium japonicum TaxID=2699430 RepID=A0A6G7VE41_9GAMM|nr:ferrochelatase [Caldichromatium japonicum]QIK38343.1 ferrochelatase [Caldichromatium japonicum]
MDTRLFVGTPDYDHAAAERLGVLLVNLGSPASPEVGAVRRYLAEFLSDRRVVEGPRLPWLLLLHGVILRRRPGRSARLYRSIWTEAGAPLLAIARRQAEGLQRLLDQRVKGSVQVALGMRYGEPSIAQGLETLRLANARRILILPLYPQYSATTIGTVFDAAAQTLMRWRWLPELRLVNGYGDEPVYIATLADKIRAHWSAHGQAERLLLSFHGIPQRYFDQGDPYFCQCHKTARLLAEALGLAEGHWALAFQSRLGKGEWLRPYTDAVLSDWARAGVKSVQIAAPGFAADCLETLEELAVENRERFIAAGGERYEYIPCLNDDPAHLEMLARLVVRHCSGWPELTGTALDAVGLEARAQRARALGGR